MGRKTKQIYETLSGMADEIDNRLALSDAGSDAFGDALDALTGMCHPSCQYKDSPSPRPESPTPQPTTATREPRTETAGTDPAPIV